MNSVRQLPTYPILRFFLARGVLISFFCGIACALLGLYFSLITGIWILVLVGIGAGLLIGLLLMAFVELIHIIFDTLVPR